MALPGNHAVAQGGQGGGALGGSDMQPESPPFAPPSLVRRDYLRAQPPCPPWATAWFPGKAMRLWKKSLIFDSIKKFQLDIVACATNGTETCHILGALPTGYGKSLPMLVTGLLMPPVEYSLNIFNCSILTKVFLKRFYSPCNQPFDYNRPAVNQRLQSVPTFLNQKLVNSHWLKTFFLWWYQEFVPTLTSELFHAAPPLWLWSNFCALKKLIESLGRGGNQAQVKVLIWSRLP